MTKEELFFENETRKHQKEVARCLMKVANELNKRAMNHDASKLESPEREIFIEFTPKLKMLTYGSDEYKATLEAMKPALEHHYGCNKHHPEYNTINCYSPWDEVGGMDLVDIVEMLCDWFAASKRHEDGDVGKSININEERFHINSQLSQIFRNTVYLMKHGL